ncbi:MAG: PAAR-like protein [Flavobacterium sp.]
MRSVIFKGNCKKSPQSSSPCASVMQLGNWTNVGTFKVQEQFPLLLKSTIMCNYGGVSIKITDCAQRSKPENIEIKYIDIIPDEKTIINVEWRSEDLQENITSAIERQGVNLMIKTRNYKEGEIITLKIKEATGREINEGVKEIILSGIVKADNTAQLKEQLILNPVTDKPRDRTLKQLQREQQEETEIYITRKGINYTKAEWKQYQDNWHDEMEKIKALKNRSFWDSIKK